MPQKPDYRKIIEDSRKAGSIISPDFFKVKEARDALYKLNMESVKKPAGSTIDEAIEAEKKRKAKFGGK